MERKRPSLRSKNRKLTTVLSKTLSLGELRHRYTERIVSRINASAVSMVIPLVDRENPKVKEHPACYYNQAEMLIPALQEAPWLLKTPIVRNGNRMTVGYQPDVWEQWT